MNAPLRVAIVGAGPAGLYAASHLLEGPGGTYLNGQLHYLVHRPVEVDVFDRLVTPWGLVRHGVAPDHPEKKLVHTVFDALHHRPWFRYYGNVEVWRDIQPAELSSWYDAVIYAVGASGDNRLGIAGEDLPGSWSAREFVAWYNGHPEYRNADFRLDHKRAVVIGNGNVALDVARILTLPIADLERTDIAPHALATLRNSAVREVVLLGRRGPEHAAFSNPELEELGDLPGVDLVVDRADVPEAATRKLATLRRFAERPLHGHDRRIVLRFDTSPLEIRGRERVESVQVTGGDVLDTGLVLRSIGYFGLPIDGIPFDTSRGVIPNEDGRVVGLDRTYVTGWIKRGPRGIIGTNKKCARDTVRTLLADASTTATSLPAMEVERRVRERRPDFVNAVGWLRLDDHERRLGRLAHQPRQKVCDPAEQLSLANG
ncbi:MAG: FAD-dependent oxidoreductase [Nocardiaceae bacterium]|nr:FAD-dependent oxidoreductase [Nocardiaceae bacterium]